ncbi:MAG: CvpA family protein [Bacteroidota bacterium]|jgi:membrane protein required for colicin V production|nr:CvpA family protein [Bacteroidota bacterium]
MLIDVVMFILVIVGLLKGLKRGFIVAIFSIVAVIAGLVIAFKTFEWVAVWLQTQTALNSQWMSFVAFALVLLVVMIGIHFIANVLQQAIEMLWMGFLNKLLGIVLYVFLYTSIGAIIIFYAVQVHVLSNTVIHSSKIYPAIEKYVPMLLHKVGLVIPFLQQSVLRLRDILHI